MTEAVEKYQIKARNNRWVDARFLLELPPGKTLSPRHKRLYPLKPGSDYESLAAHTGVFRYLFEVGTEIRCLTEEHFRRGLVRCGSERESETSESHTATLQYSSWIQPNAQNSTNQTLIF